MFSHVMLGASDLEASRRFYDAVLGALGIAPGVANRSRYFYRGAHGTFAITTPIDGEPAGFGNGATTGFAAASPEQVQAAHAAGLAHGGVSCEDPPGWREHGASARLYLAYLRDPTGNKLCLLHRPSRTAPTESKQ